MKKVSSILLVALLAVAMVFSLTACSNNQADGGAEGPSGTYVPGSIIFADGTEMTMEEYMTSALGEQGIVEGTPEYDLAMQAAEVSYTFNEDGTAVATAVGIDMTGTYTVEGTTVTITMDIENTVMPAMEYNSADNTLTAVDATTGITCIMVAK